MCGRIVGHVDVAAIKRLARINSSRKSKQIRRSFNLPPGSNQVVVVHSSFKSSIPKSSTEKLEKRQKKIEEFKNQRVLTCSRWGIDSKGKQNSSEDKAKMLHFNLRIENVRNLFTRLLNRRSVMVVDGYYEWSDSQPYLVKHKSSQVFFLACLFDADSELQAGVLTCDAPKSFQWLHHRTSCIVEDDDVDCWIDPNVSFETAASKLKTPTEEGFEIIKVSKLVNNIKNDSSDCILRFEDYEQKSKSQGIRRFFFKLEKRKDNDLSDCVKSLKPE